MRICGRDVHHLDRSALFFGQVILDRGLNRECARPYLFGTQRPAEGVELRMRRWNLWDKVDREVSRRTFEANHIVWFVGPVSGGIIAKCAVFIDLKLEDVGLLIRVRRLLRCAGRFWYYLLRFLAHGRCP